MESHRIAATVTERTSDSGKTSLVRRQRRRDDSAMSNSPPSDVNPNDDFEWTRQPFEDQFTAFSWTDGRCDQHGNPIPIRPPHLSSSFDVGRPTPEQLDTAMKTIGVTDNPAMSADERLLLRHAVAYSWAAFDEVMRPVDGPPASLKFKDVHQKPIRIALYRLTPEKIECLRPNRGVGEGRHPEDGLDAVTLGPFP